MTSGSAAVGVFALIVAIGCSTEPAASACPGQFDPGRLSQSELRREGIGKIPERDATTEDHVNETVVRRRGWIERNYPGVVDVAIGEGWGVTYTRDQYGNITYHRAPDHMIVTTVGMRKACPDPERGTLLIFGSEGLRVPVRFQYRST